MPVIITPYIPRTITVHLGAPSQNAENVTVDFPDYIKNVASSEIYPTWEPAALRANILAQISFALNRVYTEFYPSRGYNFQITSTTAMDQKFIFGRNIFENISQIVDQIFDDYIRRQGFAEPLSANSATAPPPPATASPSGGAQALAEEGLDSMSILRRYYGDDIELVVNAPCRTSAPPIPAPPCGWAPPARRWRSSRPSSTASARTTRHSQDHSVDGVFGPQTEQAVRRFQEIFGLTPDGIVGRATWYKLVFLYGGVLDLSELVSQGQRGLRPCGHPVPHLGHPQPGGGPALQYFLAVYAQFDPSVPAPSLDGIFGPETQQAVRAFQSLQGLPVTGQVDTATWNALYNAYEGIGSTVLTQEVLSRLSSRGWKTPRRSLK